MGSWRPFCVSSASPMLFPEQQGERQLSQGCPPSVWFRKEGSDPRTHPSVLPVLRALTAEQPVPSPWSAWWPGAENDPWEEERLRPGRNPFCREQLPPWGLSPGSGDGPQQGSDAGVP